MEKVRLGRSDLMVTRVGLGTIPLQRLSDKAAQQVITRCLELGINFIDTANAYTTSEERLGKGIKGRREQLVLATKSYARTARDLDNYLYLSLERLATPYLDLYQFHAVNDFPTLEKVLGPGGVMEAAVKAKASGTIRHIGISSHQIDVARKALQTDAFDTLMFPFNFVTSEAADELLPLCRKLDIGFICMKPLAGGMLENADLAFKFLFQFPDVVCIPGIEKTSEIEEIASILESAAGLTAAEQRKMQELRAALGTRFCHRCDYCQPCTAEIPISNVLSLKSFYKRLPPERFVPEFGEKLIKKALDCQDCGECESRCPYHLPIRKLIAEQVGWYRSVLPKKGFRNLPPDRPGHQKK